MDIDLLNKLIQELRIEDFLFELRDNVKEFKIKKVAKDAGLARESLYKALEPRDHGVQFTTIAKIIKALGYSLSITKGTVSVDLSQYKRNSAALNEQLKAEYHTTRNKGRSIDDESVVSRRKIWWLCINKHVWKESALKRMRGANCPYCDAQNLLKNVIQD